MMMCRAPCLWIALLLLCLPMRKAQPTEVPVVPKEAIQVEEEGLQQQQEPVDTAGSSTTHHHHQQQQAHHHHHHHVHDEHCAWGTACHPDYVEGEGHHNAHHEEKKGASGNASNSNNNHSGASSNNIPFVHHHNSNHAAVDGPPEGFAIVARVYTDPKDKLAHFTDDEEGSHITLPYWECGATGSTTSPLPVKHAYFRHSLSGSKPQVWSGTEYGPHPQLVVALKRMEMTLNSGETKQLKAGDVVLLEDVVSGGHKLKALEGFDMTYLLLTLPQHYHHVGRDQMALKRGSMEKKQSPCVNDNNNNPQQQHTPSGGGGGAFVKRHPPIPKGKAPLSSKSWENILTGGNVPDGEVAPLQEPKLRKLLLGVFGLSVTTLFADFLGKVAPLWLAVGIGGTCFVVGGTFGIVQGGDYVCSEIEMWQERRRLEGPETMDDYDDVDETVDIMETPTIPKAPKVAT